MRIVVAAVYFSMLVGCASQPEAPIAPEQVPAIDLMDEDFLRASPPKISSRGKTQT